MTESPACALRPSSRLSGSPARHTNAADVTVRGHVQTLVQALVQAPVQALVQAPVQAPVQALVQALHPSPPCTPSRCGICVPTIIDRQLASTPATLFLGSANSRASMLTLRWSIPSDVMSLRSINTSLHLRRANRPNNVKCARTRHVHAHAMCPCPCLCPCICPCLCPCICPCLCPCARTACRGKRSAPP